MYDIPQFTEAQVRKVGKDKYEAFHGGDDDLIVTFEKYPVYLEFKSQIEGRKLYEERDHIRIQFPGDRTREIFRPVKLAWDNAGPPDAERFPKQWQAFLTQSTAGYSGTVLTEWPHVNKAQVLELKAMNILTVEHLAAVTDAALGSLGLGGRELRDRARMWLDRSKQDAGMSEVLARLAALEAENRALRQGANVPQEAEQRQESFVPVLKPPASEKRRQQAALKPKRTLEQKRQHMANVRAAKGKKHVHLQSLQEAA